MFQSIALTLPVQHCRYWFTVKITCFAWVFLFIIIFACSAQASGGVADCCLTCVSLFSRFTPTLSLSSLESECMARGSVNHTGTLFPVVNLVSVGPIRSLGAGSSESCCPELENLMSNYLNTVQNLLLKRWHAHIMKKMLYSFTLYKIIKHTFCCWERKAEYVSCLAYFV